MLTNDNEFDMKQTPKVFVDRIEKKSEMFLVTLRDTIKIQKYKYWQLCKDDISPKQIFEAYQCKNELHPIKDDKHDNKIELRTEVAKYCIMDCYLVLVLS